MMGFVLLQGKTHSLLMNSESKPRVAAIHVIFGAGQIGARLRDVLLARGHQVRVVRRGRSERSTDPRLENISGDVTSLSFAAEAAAGAAVVYDCMNPPYHEWDHLLLPIARGALHGARTAGAKLVALDCLYMYGRPSGPMTEDTPLAPCSRKGELRVALQELRMGAGRRGEVAVSVGRASDFFGASLPFSGFSDRFFERILAGKAGECLGDPTMPHSYTYADDVAEALAILGSRAEAMGRIWHLPTNEAESTAALTRRIGRALGVEADSTRVPKWLLRALGVFSPSVREVVEMTYQWEVPFVIDDTRFRTTFGVAPTPIDEAVRATAAWARTRFGAGLRAA